MRVIATTVLVGVLLAGCSGDDTASTPTTTEPAPTTTTAALASTEPAASAFVSARQGELDALADVETCLSPDGCDAGITHEGLLALDPATETLLTALDGLQDPAFLAGPPPVRDEVVALIGDTTAAARQLKEATDAYVEAGCATSRASGCDQLVSDIGVAGHELQVQLDTWARYL